MKREIPEGKSRAHPDTSWAIFPLDFRCVTRGPESVGRW